MKRRESISRASGLKRSTGGYIPTIRWPVTSSALPLRTMWEITGWRHTITIFLSGVNGREYGYMNDDSNLERDHQGGSGRL